MNLPLWASSYSDRRRQLIASNDGHHAISVIGLLPNPPAGLWANVGATLAAMDSQTDFLSHLFCELVASAHTAIGEQSIWLDGFLGSAHSRQDPWLLVPTIAFWLPSGDETAPAADHFITVVRLWEDLVGSHIELSADRVPHARELGPFLPNARVPRPHITDQFRHAVRSRLRKPRPYAR